jgi:hypothetical protein
MHAFTTCIFYYFKEVNIYMNGKGKIQRPRDTVSDMCILGFYRACNKLNEEEEETESSRSVVAFN